MTMSWLCGRINDTLFYYNTDGTYGFKQYDNEFSPTLESKHFEEIIDCYENRPLDIDNHNQGQPFLVIKTNSNWVGSAYSLCYYIVKNNKKISVKIKDNLGEVILTIKELKQCYKWVKQKHHLSIQEQSLLYKIIQPIPNELSE